MEVRPQLQEARAPRFQFSLHELLRFVTLAPLSIGFVHVVESCSSAILMMLARDRVIASSKSIASYLGLLQWGHGIIVLAIMHVVATFLLIAFFLLMFYTRFRWFKETALSVIFAAPLLTTLDFVWLPGIRIDLHNLQVLLAYSVAPTAVSIILFVVYRLLAIRLKNAPDVQVHNSHTRRQKLMGFTILAFFLTLSFYGWYDLRRSHDETLRDLRVWQERAET